MVLISEEQWLAGLKTASNSIVVSNHESSTHSLKLNGKIQLDSAAVEGQTQASNTFGSGHDSMIGRLSSLIGMFESFHSLPLKSQTSLLVTV